MILFGASGHSKVILDILLQNKISVECVYDDKPKTDSIFGIPVRANSLKYYDANDAIISIGNNSIRKSVSEKYPNLKFVKAIHFSSIISTFADVGEGTVVMANVTVNPDAKIGKHCILNTGCVVEHDCIIEDFVHISPNAALAGNVTVGEGSQIGIGASIIQGVKVGKWSIVGAGSVIISDIPDYSVVVGNPGKVIKKNIIINEQ